MKQGSKVFLYRNLYSMLELKMFCNLSFQAGINLYLYVFEHRPDFSLFPRWTGAFHGVDIGFVFGAPFKRMRSLVDFFTPKFSEIEKGFSLYVMKLWTDFAKFG